MSDLINYNDMLEQLRNSVPADLQDKAEKVNQALNTALGVHMLLSHYDFYKNTFGNFADKMAEKGIQVKDSLNNIIEDPTSILDTEAGKTVTTVAKKQLNKLVSKVVKPQPQENIELSTIREQPQAPPVDEAILFPGAENTDILPLANIYRPPEPPTSNLPEITPAEPGTSLTSQPAFRSFTQMQPQAPKISSFSELPSLEEGQEALSGARGFIGGVSRGLSAVKARGAPTFKALTRGDFSAARQDLENAINDPEFGQFVDPLRRATTSLFNKFTTNVQSTLEDRFNRLPPSMKEILKSSGLDENNLKLSLMEPDEFNQYLGSLRGSAQDKINDIKQAYQGARTNVEEIANNLKQSANNTQQAFEELGGNMQERLTNLQQNLAQQTENIQNSAKQSAIDASKQLTQGNINPTPNNSNAPGDNIANDVKKSSEGDLADLTEDSTALDEDPIGAGITALLGIATLGDTIYNAIEMPKNIPSQVGFQMGV
jgi:hypothetical protein